MSTDAPGLPEFPGERPSGSEGQPTSSGPGGSTPPGDAEQLPAVSGYEILGVIGSGGQGVVYRARHIGLDRIVALKILRDSQESGPEQGARFRREARVIARLDHPNIVRIYGFDESAGRLFLSMEYLGGGSLKDRLGRQGLFAAQEAVELLLALVPAVEHAHQKGVVHRDLKPANVLFTAEGDARIVDFGVAKIFDDSAGQHTRTGAILGSPSYMAPEQAAGKISQVGPATDIYALGAILYEILTGRPPFSGESWLDTLDRVRFQPVVPPSRWRADVPDNLERICIKCLDKVPERRYPNAAAFAAALQQFISSAPADGPSQPRSSNPELAARSAQETVVSEGYRLLRRIHAGALGEIWSATAPGGITVAVKIYYQPVEQDQHRKRALDLIKNLNHPYLLKTHAYWVNDGRMHVAMELADSSLRKRLKRFRRQRQGGIPPAALLVYLKETAEALDYLHDQGLIHCNVTPDSILLLKEHVKVGDFSLVCDGEGSSWGAPVYMAPEQYRDVVTPHSDQYSLAITYVELRRDRRPFPARTTLVDAMMDAVEGSPDLGDLSKPEKAVLLKALAKEPAQRYPNCRDFAAALTTAVPKA
jgi:serine/threonine protein kinase